MAQSMVIANENSGCAYRVVSCSDAHLQAQAMSYDSWTQRYDQLSPGSYDGSIEEVQLLPFTVLRERSNRKIFQRGAVPAGMFAVGLPVRQSAEAYFCGDMLVEKQLTILNPAKEFQLRTSEDFELVAVVFSPDTLTMYLDEPGNGADDLRRRLENVHGAHSSPAVQSMESFLVGLLAAASVDRSSLQSVETAKWIAEEYVALLDQCLDPGARERKHSVWVGRDRLVRRVCDYIEQRNEDPPRIADICRDLGVTRRTLQNAMQEVLGVSPQAYLKAIRLNGLRRALRTRNAARESIGDIAANWGFWHLSHMAQDYRRQFGELPSETSAAN
jgi:AraC family ethanolamine operon transcriptional activator